jgi:thioester reductase-like protein
MNIQGFYKDKIIFITGTTGFVGKVVLEKIMRSLSDYKRIYIMVRSKKGMSNQTRLEEIFKSELFDPLFKANPELRHNWPHKIFPIAGDLTLSQLGMSAESRAILQNEVQIIINCAASVNFDDPLLDALNINYFGCMRMLDLAQSSKSVEVFTHVSTAYVNSNREGVIEEKVYDLENGKDPEKLVEEILKLNPQQVLDKEKEIIGAYPNTYTFTKALTERTLQKRRSNIKICIVRPSIVISAFKEPCVGWTETLSAMGGLVFAVMLGLINHLHCNSTSILDIVPVDFVSNLILCTTAFAATDSKNLNIVHSSTSQQNPAYLFKIIEIVLQIFKTQPS